MKSNSIKGYLNADLTIASDTKKFRSTKLEGIDEMVDLGYRNAVDMMPEIMKVFAGKYPKKKKKDFGKDDILFI